MKTYSVYLGACDSYDVDKITAVFELKGWFFNQGKRILLRGPGKNAGYEAEPASLLAEDKEGAA